MKATPCERVMEAQGRPLRAIAEAVRAEGPQDQP